MEGASKKSRWLRRRFETLREKSNERISSDVGGPQARPPTSGEFGGETPNQRFLAPSGHVADIPFRNIPLADTMEIFELDASQVYLCKKTDPSTEILPVTPKHQELIETFQPEPFLVPFNIYSSSTHPHPIVSNPLSIESWELQLPTDYSGGPELCKICLLVNVRENVLDIPHHHLEDLKASITAGCPLCRLIFECALKHNHVASVKQWYSYHQPTIEIRVRQSTLTFKMGYLERVFELYRLRGGENG
jgi:hypothetical protein